METSITGAQGRAPAHRPVRGTQLLVEHMNQVFRRPSLIFIEIGWRWLVGIPILMVAWSQARQILAAYPLDSSGFNSIDAQNPWLAAVQIAAVWNYYAPHVAAVLRWFVPVAALAWIVVSGIARNLLLRRIDSRLRFRPIAMIALQALWMALLAVTFWGWYCASQWVAVTHITVNGEPDLVGYAIWTIFLSLGFFTGWALISWALSVAPLIMLLERRSALSALGSSFRLGKAFTSKLAEINLVMGIVKLALMVLAMVFSAAPIPFSDQLGPTALHYVTAASFVFYLVANDYFHVVRVKAFVAFWHIFREPQLRSSAQ
jgi:hypothetical protein